ncbi:MAG: lysophospholipid acyltransferase family protein [Gammaproteobacteria bacterium]|nr:lysophospholipid acyltransferase family protein [Gammaproteobacteria bacterium]
MAKQHQSRKPKFVQRLEYAVAYLLIAIAQSLPFAAVRVLGSFLGNLFYNLARRRRRIALENLRHAYGDSQSPEELKRIARESFISFFYTFLEIFKFKKMLHDPDRILDLSHETESIEALLQRVQEVHKASGGCIFVTPHLGNWEVLPHASAYIGVPLVVVARPLSNAYLEKLLYSDRTATGQILIPKRNAMFMLQKTLHKGNSIGLLADQATRKAISVDFFGRQATTTPVPAILAVSYRRPIVVVACCRNAVGKGFDGFMAEPIWPGEYQSEKQEIYRLTREMNAAMESIIRQRPEQYLWMHNRWKVYSDQRQLGINGKG